MGMTNLQGDETNNNHQMDEVNLSTDGEFETWTVTVVCILLAPITTLGAAGNVISIKIFYRLGISDGVNMSLISLATSDLLYLISAFINTISLTLDCIEEFSSYKVWFPVDPEAIYTIFTNVASGFYAISILVTTFITIVRCLAVAQPLKYRNLLSWQTTAIIISIFFVLSVTSAVLLLSFTRILPKFDTDLNTTRPVLWFAPVRATFKIVIFGLRDLFLPLASQIIVGICVVIMARYLQRATYFRRKLSRYIALDTLKGFSRIEDPVGNVKTLTNHPASSKVAGKELQVVQQMLLIAIVYSLCNMPKVVFNLVQLILPDFNRGGRYNAAYLIGNVIRELIQSVNASVTIFIYWKYNSKFRNHFILHH